MLILIKWYLLNVAFSMTKALVKVLPNKIFILPTSLPFLVEKPYFSYVCFPLFHSHFLILNFIKFQLASLNACSKLMEIN